MTLEKMLREVREIENVTQGDLARELGVHAQFISNVERGSAQLPLKYFKKVSKLLKIKLNLMIQMRMSDLEREVKETINNAHSA